MKDYTEKVRSLVDDIKAICANNGLGGEANEYKIVTQSFLYKFLNDKFLYGSKKTYEELKKRADRIFFGSPFIQRNRSQKLFARRRSINNLNV